MNIENVNEIRCRDGELTRIVGTVEELSIEKLVSEHNKLKDECERKEKVLTNMNNLLDRIGDRVYDYYKY